MGLYMARQQIPESKEQTVIHLFRKTVCSFCGAANSIDHKTLTCVKCNTTMPRNYGPGQRKDRHGNKL